MSHLIHKNLIAGKTQWQKMISHALKQIPVPILTKVYILSNQKHIFIIIFSAENVDH